MILIIGQCGDYPERGYNSSQAFACRDIELGVGLWELGEDVELAAAHSKKIRGGRIQCIRWEEVNPERYEHIVFSEFWGHCRAMDQSCFPEIKKHPSVACVLDAVTTYDRASYRDLGHCKCIGVGYAPAAVQQLDALPHVDVFLLPWGYMEIPLEPDPWEGKRELPIVVYIGAIQRRFMPILNKLANTGRYEVWVGGMVSLDDGLGWRGAARAELHGYLNDRVKLITSLMPQSRVSQKDDLSLLHGTFWSCYQWANVGLNLMPMGKPWTYNSKVYDMLSCGLPIVSEEWSANNGDILYLEAGKVVPQEDAAALVDAVDEVAGWQLDRGRRVELARRACMLGTWKERARVLLSHLKMPTVRR